MSDKAKIQDCWVCGRLVRATDFEWENQRRWCAVCIVRHRTKDAATCGDARSSERFSEA